MVAIVKKNIARLVKDIRKLLKRKTFFCPVCKRKVHSFNRLPDSYFEQLNNYQYIHNIFYLETLNMWTYSCPICGASDRDRLYALYLSQYLKDKSISFLDIAPFKNFSGFIKSFKDVKYRTADLYMKGVDDKMDITDMSLYADGSFDFVLCSHVLEHVEDDEKALHEIYRILSPGSRGILMVPIQLDLKDDYKIDIPLSEAERWHHYGQGDHIRTYSKSGFLRKIRNAGFLAEEITVANYSPELFKKCGISERSVLYVVTKHQFPT